MANPINFLRHIRRFEILDGKHWIEIRRRVGGRDINVYDHPIRCWINPRTQDNPDAQVVLTQPIIKSLEIYTFPEIDIQNGDFLIVQKTNRQGRLLGSWRGRCGEPFRYEPFQTVNMAMQALGSDAEPPTPPPTANISVIYVHFLNDEHVRIHDSIIHRVEIGEQVHIPHLFLDGYVFEHIVMDGTRIDADDINFEAKGSVYNVTFFYIGSKLPTALKPLLNSAFMRANGSSGNGWHLYENIAIRYISDTEIEPSFLRFTHSTTFRTINLSTAMNNTNSNIIVLYPMMEWRRITAVTGNILVIEPYTPSPEQAAAYVYQF